MYIPFEFHAGLIDLIAENPDRFQPLTYGDLPWEDDYDYHKGYPDEARRWREAVKAAGDDRVHILIQHDVDHTPAASMELVRYELAAGVPSNVMVFARYHNRNKLEDEGVLEYAPYELDLDLLKRAESSGFDICYHTNCVEQALWDLDAAARRFEEDVALLRMHFDLKFFSPHGGVPGPDGQRNVDVPVGDLAELGVRWVHNLHSVSFNGYYSDGGIAGARKNPDRWNLRKFVAGMEGGKRYRILTHPQYYQSPPNRHPALEEADWYGEIMNAYEAGSREFWRAGDY